MTYSVTGIIHYINQAGRGSLASLRQALLDLNSVITGQASALSLLTAAELAYLDGATVTNATTSKAAILGTDGALVIGGPLTVGASGTLSAAELAVLDSAGVTNNTALKAAIMNTDGQLNVPKAQIAQSATGLVGFHGATPITQPSGAAQAEVTFSIGWLVASATNTSGAVSIGFDTTAHAVAAFDLLVEIRRAFVLRGDIKGAA